MYRDLIDLYMDTEQELMLDLVKLKRRVLANSNEESTAVEQVLNEFFTETPTGWFHSRCESEITAYRANTSQKAMAGKASAAAKALKMHQALNGASTPVQHPLKSVETKPNGASTNQEPRTINHKPKKNTSAIAPPEGVSDSVWQDFLKIRAAKKAPMTDTALEGIRAEAVLAGIDLSAALKICCARGWQGFKAKWLEDKGVGQQPTQAERSFV